MGDLPATMADVYSTLAGSVMGMMIAVMVKMNMAVAPPHHPQQPVSAPHISSLID